MARWPAVVDALLTLLPTLPGWAGVSVYDGPPVTARGAASYAVVGSGSEEDSAGGYERVRSDVYPLWEETGTVRVDLVVMSGQTGLSALRSSVFELVDALQDALAADQRVAGTLSPDGTVDVSVDVLPVQNAAGAAVRALLTVSYFDRS